jgi:riboflavin kinase/FMN adenylyltransferase
VAATIGSFDGVHRGHRHLIRYVQARAAALGLQSAVITFDPHPRQVLRPDTPTALLSTVQDRVEVFEQLGVDVALVWRFDTRLQSLTAEQFLAELNRRVTLRCLVHGPGFALGRRRHGTPDVLAELGRRLGFAVEAVAPLRSGAEPVSSSAIRRLVEAGRVEDAAAALDRWPSVTGTVVEGEKVGRALGFPTANLDPAIPMAVPADGVYAAWAELAPYTPQARLAPAAVSIGVRPTFGGARRVIEAYLLDFAGDLYGQPLRLHFVARLRGQERFEGIEPLIAQMRRDVAAAWAVLGATPRTVASG